MLKPSIWNVCTGALFFAIGVCVGKRTSKPAQSCSSKDVEDDSVEEEYTEPDELD